jgi:hypothetical protein
MIIHVTQKHINKGRRANCRRCPIALAVHEATGETGVVVGSHIRTGVPKADIWPMFIPGPKRNCYRMTQACFKFMNAFDRRLPVKPFSFRLIKESY